MQARVTDVCLKLNQRSIVVLVMALLHYFQSTASLPTAEETRDTVMQSTNTAILREVQAK